MYYSPEGKDPGALTASEFMTKKYQANTRNVMFKAGESVGGFLTAIKSIYTPSEKATWITSVFYSKNNVNIQLGIGIGHRVLFNKFIAFN